MAARPQGQHGGDMAVEQRDAHGVVRLRYRTRTNFRSALGAPPKGCAVDQVIKESPNKKRQRERGQGGSERDDGEVPRDPRDPTEIKISERNFTLAGEVFDCLDKDGHEAGDAGSGCQGDRSAPWSRRSQRTPR